MGGGASPGVFFQGDSQDVTDAALQELGVIRRQWFSELREEAEQLVTVHRRLIDFLLTQRTLRLRDPEAWLESDHDAGHMQLWQQHCGTVQAMEQRLGSAENAAGAAARSTSAA